MNNIDLHVHSNASDGTMSPSQVVELAARCRLSAIALTDHDTTAGIQEARQAAARAGIELVPGIEFSCVYQDTEIHILGLFIREEDPALSYRELFDHLQIILPGNTHPAFSQQAAAVVG